MQSERFSVAALTCSGIIQTELSLAARSSSARALLRLLSSRIRLAWRSLPLSDIASRTHKPMHERSSIMPPCLLLVNVIMAHGLELFFATGMEVRLHLRDGW